MTAKNTAMQPQGVYTPLGPQKIVVGVGQLDTIDAEVTALGAERICIITSPSVATQTPLITQLESTLGARVKGVFQGVIPHTPIPNLFEAAAKAREVDADCLISIGGGSSIDTGKAVAFVLDHDIRDMADLEPYLGQFSGGQQPKSPERHQPPRQIAIPTTGCAAEFSGIAGITDTDRGRKYLIVAPAIMPDVVILDPLAPQHTPHDLWLSTLVRSVDHAIEAAYSKLANPHTLVLSDEAMRLLYNYMPRIKAAPDDLEARGSLQVAAWHSSWAALGASTGLSHGIGYVLGGSFDVPHGICSCVMLPTVMKWNLPHCVGPLNRVGRAIGVVDNNQTDQQNAINTVTAVKSLITQLGLPTRLSSLGTLSKEDLEQVADLTMDLPHLQTNPRPTKGKADLMELLEMAW